MNMERLRQICDYASKLFKENKQLAPFLVVEGLFATAVIQLEFKDRESKHAVMEMAGKKSAHILPREVTVVTEAWTSKTMPQNGQGVSDLPDAEECIVVINNKVGEGASGIVVPFTRIGNEIMFGEPMETDENTEVTPLILVPFWRGVLKGTQLLKTDLPEDQNN